MISTLTRKSPLRSRRDEVVGERVPVHTDLVSVLGCWGATEQKTRLALGSWVEVRMLVKNVTLVLIFRHDIGPASGLGGRHSPWNGKQHLRPVCCVYLLFKIQRLPNGAGKGIRRTSEAHTGRSPRGRAHSNVGLTLS